MDLACVYTVHCTFVSRFTWIVSSIVFALVCNAVTFHYRPFTRVCDFIWLLFNGGMTLNRHWGHGPCKM